LQKLQKRRFYGASGLDEIKRVAYQHEFSSFMFNGDEIKVVSRSRQRGGIRAHGSGSYQPCAVFVERFATVEKWSYPWKSGIFVVRRQYFP
ncbi:hypothetical protein DPQ33_18455, partial [Oceanidesulfovibrio indonesiensis]